MCAIAVRLVVGAGLEAFGAPLIPHVLELTRHDGLSGRNRVGKGADDENDKLLSKYYASKKFWRSKLEIMLL